MTGGEPARGMWLRAVRGLSKQRYAAENPLLQRVLVVQDIDKRLLGGLQSPAVRASSLLTRGFSTVRCMGA